MGIYSIQPRDEVLNEVYFGETPGIMRCFEAFSTWRSKYLMDRKLYMMNSAAERDPLLGKFVAEIEREFGLYSYSFVIVNGDMVNAFTFPTFFNFNSSLKGTQRVEFGKDGYKFKKECQVSMLTCMFAGMFFSTEFSNREAFAIILHEIGHNFQDVISDRMHTIGQVSKLNQLVLAGIKLSLGDYGPLMYPLFNDKIIGAVSKSYNEMNIGQKNSLISTANTLYGIYSNTLNLGLDILCIFLPPINIGKRALKKLRREFIKLITAPFEKRHSYYGEIMADKFASYYGFGKDLVTGLSKFEDPRTDSGLRGYIMRIPIYSHIQTISSLPLQWISEVFDEHPATQVRYKNILDGLNEDLNQPGISPKLKKQLKGDIKETEDTIEEILENGKKIENPAVVQNFIHSFLYHACGGDLKYLIRSKEFNTEKDVQQTYIKNTKIK